MSKKILILTVFSLSAILSACSSFMGSKTDDGRSLYSQGGDIGGDVVLQGRVFEYKTEKPVKNAFVEIKNSNLGVGYYSTQTDASGNFTIKNFIPFIQYDIEVTADGYVTYISNEKLGRGKKEISLEKEAIITGTIQDSAGRPINNVDVSLEYGEYGGDDRPLTASANGSYSFNKLRQGSYKLVLMSPGYISETMYIKSVRTGSEFKLPVTLYRPASISGNILISGADVPAANIDVIAKGQVTHSISTYQDGSFKLDDMKPGSYEFSVQHMGFREPAKRTVAIKEGESKTGVNYSLDVKNPEVQLSAYRYTFAPGNSLTFNLRTFRLESVTVTVYAVPVEVFLRGRSDPDSADPVRDKLKKVAQWDEPMSNFDPYTWLYGELTIKDPLPTGGYLVEAKGAGSVISRKYFTVTSIGTVVKRSENKIFAYVSNLITNEPVKDASIAVFENTPVRENNSRYEYYRVPGSIDELPVKILAKGKTNEDGIYQQQLKTQYHMALIAISPDGSYALCDAGLPSEFQREKDKYMVYTDRPVYRDGDTVFYKIIGKERKEGFVPQSGKVYYKIMNNNTSLVLSEGWTSLDDWGTANGSFVVSGAGLGPFTIRVGASENAAYDSGLFYVEQYRKPEYSVEIVPSRDFFINGDELEFKVEGRYFFGAPVKGALVSYHFYEKKIDDSDSYWWEDDAPRDSYNRLKLEGVKYLDDNGLVSLKLAAGSFPFDREITLEVSVIDRSNVSITSRKTVRVGRGEFYIKINPTEQFFRTDGKKSVQIKTLKQNGEPVKADVKLELFRYIWKPYQRVYVHEDKPRYSEKITTDSNGDAVFSLPAKLSDSGEYDIVATALDRRSNRITASRVIWIYAPDGSGNVASKFRNLELVVNRTEFTGDGELTCLVKSRYADAYACITIEGRDIYQSKVVKMSGNITPVTLKIDSAYAPNFYVSAVMQRKRALYTETQGISIPVKGTRLNVSIKPEKEKYAPGDTASISLNATDENGKPVSADLSLGAVDEAIYSVRRDHTPKMRDFFYAPISNWVLTSYSYPITLLAGAGKDAEFNEVRQNFKDTAFWQANIRTDANGNAKVSFKLPDNLTTWRVTVRGHDKSGRVGENKNTFLVTQDLVARIAKPRFLVEGDSVSLLGIVNSNTERGLTNVKTEMKVNGKTVSPDKEIPISLPAYASERKSYTINIPSEEKEISLLFSADSDAKAKDAVQLSVGIERRGAAFKLFGIGDMSANRSLNLAPQGGSDFEFVPESVSVVVNPTPVTQIIKASDYLVKYPYGCVEQTTSSFMPVFALHRFLKQQNMLYLVKDEYVQKIEEKTDGGLRRLENSQNYDGTWGWWAGGDGNEYLTAYVMEALWKARQLGCRLDATVVAKGMQAVNRMLENDNDFHALAYLLYVSSLHGNFNRQAFERLRALSNPNAYISLYILKALSVCDKPVFSNDKNTSETERKKYIAAYTALLKNSAQRDSSGIFWQLDNKSGWDYSGWEGGKAEMTANALSALSLAGDTSAVTSQSVSSISKRSRGGEWRSTKETAFIIYAFIDYMDRSKALTGEPLNVKFTMDGKEFAAVKYDPKTKDPASELVKTVELEGFKGQKAINITANGEAGPDVTFDVVVNGTLYFKPSGILSVFKSEGRGLASLSNGITMYREFAALTRVQDVKRREYLVPAALKENALINVGDELLVKLRFKAEDDFEFLVLEDYLPSGFEVVRESAYGSVSFDRLERRDNRMVYFFSNIRKGETCEIAYIVRAELAGKFMARPARMECMYEPSIQGWSMPVVIDVKEK
ncbi:MAG: carboxypeptidase regulatory-like domain-containing protein [Leptospirales bacterium]|nr:carboxypeptidase regulatory-like domain-containing protein [Leptospirales bacterium]